MTKQISVGKIKIGGKAPVVIQSMAKTDTRDVSATVRQIKELEKAGCEIVRVAIKDFQAASAIKKIRKRINIPLVADIHFDYRLAIEAVENGADKIRLNPGNIYKEEQIRAVARAAKKRKIPIRVGINSGSLGRCVGYPDGQPTRLPRVKCADLMVKAAPVLGVIVSILVVVSFDLEAKDVAVVGSIPAGLPSLVLPSFNLPLVKELLNFCFIT